MNEENILLERTYNWTMSLAERKNALLVLALVAFVESSVFPIPPDILLIPMVLAARERAWIYALVCTLASVIGGFAGYGIGFFLYEAVGVPILEFYGVMAKFAEFQGMYNDQGAWIVFFAGVTPFPYKVITIASGVTALDPMVFGVASVVARGLRFFIVAALLWKFGPPIRTFIEKRLGLVFTIFVVGLIGGFVALKFLH